jgi:flagellin
MRINNNIMALNAHRQLAINQSNASKSMEKLSSGFRINRAADDAAGLSISEKMRSQIRGLKQAARNAQDGISLIQTAEGALNETHAILQRMRELVVQAGSVGTNQPEDLTAIQDEINELIAEINGISERTAFNGKTLLDGSLTGDGVLTFQIGANQKQAMTLEISDMSASGLGLGGVETLTQAEDTVAGVESQTVLQNAAGENVAVKVGTDWYAIEDVEEDGSGGLKAKTATAMTVTEGKAIDGQGFYTEAVDTVAEVENQTVLQNAAGENVAVKVGNDWYAIEDVEVDENTGELKAMTGAEPKTVTEGKAIDGEGFYTEAVDTVAGVEGQTVLQNAAEENVAVKVGDHWYAIDDVEADGTGGLKAKTVATAMTVTEGKAIDGEGFYTEAQGKVAGVDSTVLQNAEGEYVAVKVGDHWYAIDDVEADGTGGLKAKTDATALSVTDVAVLGDGTYAGSSINVAEFKTSDDFDKAVGLIDTAIGLVSSQRSKLGANQNRLEHTISNLNNAQENLQAAESRIRDLDMAEEIMAFTKNNILQQAATAMLAQANMAPQSVLQLLG